MNEPTRLLQDAPSDLEAELLRSVATERPTFEHRARVRQAMGLAAGGSVPPAAGPGSLAASKAAIAGLVVAGAIAALLARGTFSQKASLHPGTAIEVIAAPTLVAPTESPAPVVTDPLAPVAPSQALPSAGAPPSPTPRATAIIPSRTARDSKTTASETSNVSDIKDQIALIDQARAAVRRGDAAAALRTVDLYASKYPGGTFEQEAAVTRIDALDQSGNHARAASLARAFLTKHPTSAHAKHLERIAGN